MILEVDNIHTFYGETQVLFGVSLSVKKGEVVALLGPNGAGKTTTIRSILGLTRARRGSVHFNGADITRAPTHKIAQAGVGWVPDDRRIFPTLTVRRNLEIARKTTGFANWTIDDACKIFAPLEHLLPRECENLSGGEMQMVAISRALVGAPGLILLDEPSQGLAPKIVNDVMNVIRRLREEGLSMLIVEQNVNIALSVADRVFVMNHGRIVEEGPAENYRKQGAARAATLAAAT
ncbi:ABC transporter ATP-binding protein [Acuticoccus sp. M5D2P5]|uniref:ABC transporter ATP-binding protein n=1 Tax=Acuticoccus kalidii TaxID=2910977 RepID=UPI001F2E56CE|nr:ABC transporter ATP-binding protein [Acuticoccus kalidii]MCF3935187.1 ABC transporter ATP-binding protein [Acuticoccus kalidii]